MAVAAPRGLKSAGRKLWKATTEKYEMREDELATLKAACAEADLIDRMEKALLDEPLTALDVAMVERLNTRIVQHAAQGGRVMLTSHQLVACVTHTVDLAQHVVVAEDDR